MKMQSRPWGRLCMPFIRGSERIRTAVEAFAELCLATRPQNLLFFFGRPKGLQTVGEITVSFRKRLERRSFFEQVQNYNNFDQDRKK
jgi:hypothetical protein